MDECDPISRGASQGCHLDSVPPMTKLKKLERWLKGGRHQSFQAAALTLSVTASGRVHFWRCMWRCNSIFTPNFSFHVQRRTGIEDSRVPRKGHANWSVCGVAMQDWLRALDLRLGKSQPCNICQAGIGIHCTVDARFTCGLETG